MLAGLLEAEYEAAGAELTGTLTGLLETEYEIIGAELAGTTGVYWGGELGLEGTGTAVAVTGQMVVYAGTTLVTTVVERAGQLVTVAAQLVIVTNWVV
jgi:hypothetical protein